MTARPLAPEADLAHVLDLAKVALQTGTMIDPEDLLCDLLDLDQQELQAWLDQQPCEHTDPTAACGHCDPFEALAPDQSRLVPRARDDGLAGQVQAGAAAWRVAEAGTVAHLQDLGRPLCGSTDAGPWRAVVGALKCPACVDLAEVLARHG